MRRYNKEVFKVITSAGLIDIYDILKDMAPGKVMEIATAWRKECGNSVSSARTVAVFEAVFWMAHDAAQGKEKALR